MSAQIFSWPRMSRLPELGAGEVQVCAWGLEVAPVEADWKLLDEQEQGRARRFVRARHRDRFVRAHAGMRRILGEHAGIAATTMAFTAGQYGRPELAGHPGGLRFNLSHSGDMAVLAVSRGLELGIDVEALRPIHQDVAEHHFSPAERQALKGLPSEQWEAGFFRCWTAKEALLKGEGVGLNAPLDAFDVELRPGENPALIALRTEAKIRPGWKLFALEPAPGYLGTLAVLGEVQAKAVHCFCRG